MRIYMDQSVVLGCNPCTTPNYLRVNIKKISWSIYVNLYLFTYYPIEF